MTTPEPISETFKDYENFFKVVKKPDETTKKK